MKKLWMRLGCALIAGMLAAGCGTGGQKMAVEPATADKALTERDGGVAGRQGEMQSEKPQQQEPKPEERQSEGTQLEKAQSEEKQSDGAQPEERQPELLQPEDRQPKGTQSEESQPELPQSEEPQSKESLSEEPPSREAQSDAAAPETQLLPVSPFFTIDDADLQDKISARLNRMSLEEKAAQLFIITPDVLAGSGEPLTAADEGFKAAFDAIPVGGFIYMGDNLVDQDQTVAMLAAVQEYSEERLQLPAFACVDEEGGTVTRISGTGKFRVPTIGDMSRIGKKNDPDRAYDVGVKIGTYLHDLGFNVDFAPVADVLTNPDNQVVKLRSFGDDPNVTANMAASVAYGLASQRILGTYKHFPGHGATEADTHEGYAYTERTKEQLLESELVPFQDGIARGIPFIMAAHISLPNVTGNDVPASLSEEIIDGILRGEMGYDGIVITDALNMGAIVQEYSSAETAVKALQAGADLLLMPEDFAAAYQGVLDAVANGSLSEERIDESLRRILRVKLGYLGEE